MEGITNSSSWKSFFRPKRLQMEYEFLKSFVLNYVNYLSFLEKFEKSIEIHGCLPSSSSVTERLWLRR